MYTVCNFISLKSSQIYNSGYNMDSPFPKNPLFESYYGTLPMYVFRSVG